MQNQPSVRRDGGTSTLSQGEIKLWSNKKDQAQYESYAGKRLKGCRKLPRLSACATGVRADLYAIIKTTEKLERAFVRDAINAEQYEEACGRLIGQFKVLWASMKDTVSSAALARSGANGCCRGTHCWRSGAGKPGQALSAPGGTLQHPLAVQSAVPARLHRHSPRRSSYAPTPSRAVAYLYSSHPLYYHIPHSTAGAKRGEVHE